MYSLTGLVQFLILVAVAYLVIQTIFLLVDPQVRRAVKKVGYEVRAAFHKNSPRTTRKTYIRH